MSRILQIGAGVSRSLPRTLRQLGCATPLFVVDPGLGSQSVLRWVRTQPLCFDVPEPTTRSLELQTVPPKNLQGIYLAGNRFRSPKEWEEKYGAVLTKYHVFE
jgi:hypothetical protein